MTHRRGTATGAWLLDCAGVDRALTGDLMQTASGCRSLAWYWRQVLLAVLTLWMRVLVEHKWLAARAIVTGWALWAMSWVLFLWLGNWLEPTTITWARLGIWLPIGWTVGALHRPFQASMVFAYASFTLVMSLPVVVRTLIDGSGHPAYAPPSGFTLLVALFSLLVGGLLSARSPACPHRESADATSDPHRV